MVSLDRQRRINCRAKLWAPLNQRLELGISCLSLRRFHTMPASVTRSRQPDGRCRSNLEGRSRGKRHGCRDQPQYDLAKRSSRADDAFSETSLCAVSVKRKLPIKPRVAPNKNDSFHWLRTGTPDPKGSVALFLSTDRFTRKAACRKTQSRIDVRNQLTFERVCRRPRQNQNRTAAFEERELVLATHNRLRALGIN
jgi:hypothetical protein